MNLRDASDLIGSRLREIGLHDEPVVEADPDGTLTIAYRGRDPSGHSCRRRIEMPFDQDEAAFATALDVRLAAQRRFAARAGTPPVQPGPEMELGHLIVNGPLARRLRLDHGTRAREVLRRSLCSLMEGGSRRLDKQDRPYGLVLNANRLDHREEIGPGVAWKGRSLVIRGLGLPEQMMATLPGRPASALLEHVVLEGQTIGTVHVSHSGRSGPCIVVGMDGEWIGAEDV